MDEEIRNASHCSSHIDLISSLTKKVNEYEGLVIPKLKDQIRSYRDQLNNKSKYQNLDLEIIQNNQESPAFTRR